MSAFRVKPLTWERHGALWAAKQDRANLFYIERRGAGYVLDFHPRDARLGSSYHLTLDEAKAAAQAEWDMFVKGAIEEMP